MLARLMPREGKFFDLFNAHADRIVEGSRELAAMFGTFSELDAHAQRIDASERAADKITHETITLLHKTFITPFDRDQIHTLITTMDDILDLIQDVAGSDADRVLRSALSKLFREENDVKQVMKLRVIYDLLESITDRCEDVANVVE